jgi:hypothetical protein
MISTAEPMYSRISTFPSSLTYVLTSSNLGDFNLLNGSCQQI